MAAPFLVIPAAFAAVLGGAHLAPLAAFAGAAMTEVDGVTVDLNRLCEATDPLIDALADRYGHGRSLDEFARAADRVCAIAAAGPGFATDIRLLGVVLQTIGAAEAKLQNAPAAAPIAASAARLKTGR